MSVDTMLLQYMDPRSEAAKNAAREVMKKAKQKTERLAPYFINGKRLSQLKRPALLVLARELHERASEFDLMRQDRDQLLVRAQHAELERDLARSELSTARDSATKRLWDLGVAEGELSMERARVVSRDERIAFLRNRLTRWKRFKYFCFGVLCISTAAAILEHLWL